MLGGALLGLGLGALLSHFGLGGAVASMISTILMVALLALAAMFIYRMLRRKQNGGAHPILAGAASSSGQTPEIGSRIGSWSDSRSEPLQPAALQSAQPLSGDALGVPADFDTAGFLRHAKTYFIRLQAAWDKADINDIREFATPQMFAELKLQLQERGASPNVTDVVSLEAELLGMETSGDEHLASVKFSGMIKEDEHAPAAPFAEVWNLSKPVSGHSGWVLAGIQQLN
jgi:predicted lipid-binding transport protein (Tim44 family)